MVMIESMALGCPVISFARGAAPEIIVHGETGFLVDDLDEMVQYIPRINEIDRVVTRMHVEKNFSVQVMTKQYLEIYEKLIKTSKGSPLHALTINRGATAVDTATREMITSSDLVRGRAR